MICVHHWTHPNCYTEIRCANRKTPDATAMLCHTPHDRKVFGYLRTLYHKQKSNASSSSKGKSFHEDLCLDSPPFALRGSQHRFWFPHCKPPLMAQTFLPENSPRSSVLSSTSASSMTSHSSPSSSVRSVIALSSSLRSCCETSVTHTQDATQETRELTAIPTFFPPLAFQRASAFL